MAAVIDDPIKNEFEAAVAHSSNAILDFINSGNEQHDFAVAYFSNIREVKVTTKLMKVASVDGREYEFDEAPANDVQKVIAENASRVIAKGCHVKFNTFLASFQNLEYLYCQFRTKNIRDRLKYSFNVEDAVLDVRGLSFETITELKATCNVLRLYKAEDCIAKLNSIPKDLTFPAIKEIHTFAEFPKLESFPKILEHIGSAITNVPKLFPSAEYTSLVFNLGEFPDNKNVDDFINDVAALIDDAEYNKALHVGCVFCHINRGPKSNFNNHGWSFYYYNLQAKKEIKLSAKKTLHVIIDPRRGPAKYAKTLALDDEQSNGELSDQWYDELYQIV